MERETTKTKSGKNVQAGAVPKYTVAGVEGEKGSEAGCPLPTATSGEVLSPVERKSGAYGP